MSDEVLDPTDLRYYGGAGTFHSNGEVNVELDKAGNVVAVWFRCQPLRFTQHVVEEHRAEEMNNMYSGGWAVPSLDAVVIRDKQ